VKRKGWLGDGRMDVILARGSSSIDRREGDAVAK